MKVSTIILKFVYVHKKNDGEIVQWTNHLIFLVIHPLGIWGWIPLVIISQGEEYMELYSICYITRVSMSDDSKA